MNGGTILLIVIGLIVAFIGLAIWSDGPCWLWSLSPAGENPVRCIK